LKLGDLTGVQQRAALELVAAALSRMGYQKVMNIVNAEENFARTSAQAHAAAANPARFGRAEYYIAILGTPSPAQPWMIQFGGHHLGINLTVAGKENVLTPSHTGTHRLHIVRTATRFAPWARKRQGVRLDSLA